MAGMYCFFEWNFYVSEHEKFRSNLGTLNLELGIFTVKQTEQKVHVHTSNCQKDFACHLRRHKWTMGNILHFVVLAILI